jgi:chromosome segregation ATPase
MAYTELKQELEQFLKEDLGNRNSLQEMRRNTFLNSESINKREKELEEKEGLISELNSRVNDKLLVLQSKDEQIKELQESLWNERQDHNAIISSKDEEVAFLQHELADLKSKLNSDSDLKDEMTRLSFENNSYAIKIRELIFHIDGQNSKEDKLSKELSSRNTQFRTISEDKDRLQKEIESLTRIIQSKEEDTKLVEKAESQEIKINLLSTQLEEAKLLINSQNNSIEENANLYSDIRKQFDEAIVNLTNDKTLLAQDNANLIAELALLVYKDDELISDSNKLVAEIDILRSKIETLETAISEKQSNTEKGTTESDLSDNQKDDDFIDRLFKQIDLLNEERLILKGEKQDIEAEINILN